MGITLSLTPAEAECFDAYCTARGASRALVVRKLLRRLELKDLSPEAAQFRRLKAALPPLEDQ